MNIDTVDPDALVFDLVHETYPDDAAAIGNAALRALILGDIPIGSTKSGYKVDLLSSLQIVAAVVAIIKGIIDICKSKIFERQPIDADEAEVQEILSHLKESHPKVAENIDDENLSILVRGTYRKLRATYADRPRKNS